MLKSAKAKVDKQFATESHQLQEQKIDIINIAMEVLVYWAKKVPIPNPRQFQVHLNSAQQAATARSDGDW